MSIDEFFHQVELGTMQMCYEFALNDTISRSYLNEAEQENHISKVKVFFAKLKEKIIDAAKKVIQWFTEKMTIISNKIEEKKKSKISNKYDKGLIKSTLEKIVPEYLDSHKYYSPGYAEELNGELRYTIGTFSNPRYSSVKTIMDELEIGSNEYRSELVPDLVSMMDNNASYVDEIKKDINETKKWRDESLKVLDNMLKDNGFSSTHNYHSICSTVMNIYMAGLKMRLENSKARIEIINLAEKELSKNKDDQKKIITTEEEIFSEDRILSGKDIKKWMKENNLGGNIKGFVVYPPAIKDNDIDVLENLHVNNRKSEIVIVAMYDSTKEDFEPIKIKKFPFKNIDSNFQAFLIENDGYVVIN